MAFRKNTLAFRKKKNHKKVLDTIEYEEFYNSESDSENNEDICSRRKRRRKSSKYESIPESESNDSLSKISQAKSSLLVDHKSTSEGKCSACSNVSQDSSASAQVATDRKLLQPEYCRNSNIPATIEPKDYPSCKVENCQNTKISVVLSPNEELLISAENASDSKEPHLQENRNIPDTKDTKDDLICKVESCGNRKEQVVLGNNNAIEIPTENSSAFQETSAQETLNALLMSTENCENFDIPPVHELVDETLFSADCCGNSDATHIQMPNNHSLLALAESKSAQIPISKHTEYHAMLNSNKHPQDSVSSHAKSESQLC